MALVRRLSSTSVSYTHLDVYKRQDLHDVTLQYVEAATNLESGDMDDFARSAALLREYLKHLREHESLSWSNLF